MMMFWSVKIQIQCIVKFKDINVSKQEIVPVVYEKWLFD